MAVCCMGRLVCIRTLVKFQKQKPIGTHKEMERTDRQNLCRIEYQVQRPESGRGSGQVLTTHNNFVPCYFRTVKIDYSIACSWYPTCQTISCSLPNQILWSDAKSILPILWFWFTLKSLCMGWFRKIGLAYPQKYLTSNFSMTILTMCAKSLRQQSERATPCLRTQLVPASSQVYSNNPPKAG